MEICIYLDYEVVHTCYYSYYNEECEITNNTIKENFIVNGRKFIEIIARDLLRSDFSNFSFGANEVIIEIFDPHSGLGEDHKYLFFVKDNVDTKEK